MTERQSNIENLHLNVWQESLRQPHIYPNAQIWNEIDLHCQSENIRFEPSVLLNPLIFEYLKSRNLIVPAYFASIPILFISENLKSLHSKADAFTCDESILIFISNNSTSIDTKKSDILLTHEVFHQLFGLLTQEIELEEKDETKRVYLKIFIDEMLAYGTGPKEVFGVINPKSFMGMAQDNPLYPEAKLMCDIWSYVIETRSSNLNNIVHILYFLIKKVKTWDDLKKIVSLL